VVSDVRGLAVALRPDETDVEVRDNRVGRHLWPLVSALLDARPTAVNLQLLRDNAAVLGVVVGDWQAEGWQSEMMPPLKEKGLCAQLCGCDDPDYHPSFRPKSLGQQPVTVGDYLLASVSADVEREWTMVQGSKDFGGCLALVALRELLAAASDERLKGLACALVDTMAPADAVPQQIKMGGKKKGAAVDPVAQWLEATKEMAQPLEESISNLPQDRASWVNRRRSVSSSIAQMRARDTSEAGQRDSHIRQALETGSNCLPGFSATEIQHPPEPVEESPEFVKAEPLPARVNRIRVGRAGDTLVVDSVESAERSLSAGMKAASMFKASLSPKTPKSPTSDGDPSTRSSFGFGPTSPNDNPVLQSPVGNTSTLQWGNATVSGALAFGV